MSSMPRRDPARLDAYYEDTGPDWEAWARCVDRRERVATGIRQLSRIFDMLHDEFRDMVEDHRLLSPGSNGVRGAEGVGGLMKKFRDVAEDLERLPGHVNDGR